MCEDEVVVACVMEMSLGGIDHRERHDRSPRRTLHL
jgi:hypothetical protein